MPLNGRTMKFSLVLALTAVAGIALSPDQQTLMAASTAKTSTLNSEIAAKEIRRIHAHFDSVLIELQTRDISALNKDAAASRGKLVQTLVSYNTRGEFPHNYDFAPPTPYFVDYKTGTLCAVAYLLESTGRRDIVDRVAKANNNVWVAQLSSDSAFKSWLDVQGITLEEAARIQVPYESSADRTANTIAMVGAPLALGTALATTTWNAWGNRDGHNRFGSHAGLASGIVVGTLSSITIGWSSGNNRVRAVGVGGLAVGTLGIGLAARSMLHRPRYLAEKRDKENARRANVEASISPIIPMGKDGGAGLSMNIRF